MKKCKKIAIFSSIGVLLLSSCGGQNQNKMVIVSLPNKQEYVIGERLSLDGLIIADKKTNNEVYDYETSQIDGYLFKAKDVGNYKITVSKQNYSSVSFTVQVYSQPVSKYLVLDSYPDKTEYLVGETFSLEGMVVSDSNTGTIIEDYISSLQEGYVFKESDIGYINVSISKSGYESATFGIYISSSLTKIKLEAVDELERYYDSLDINLYTDDNKEVLSDLVSEYTNKIYEAESIAEVEQLLSEVKGKIDAVPVQTEIIGIYVENLPLRTTFTAGDELNLNGLEVYADLDGGAYRKLKDYKVTAPDMNVPIEQASVKITYEDFSTSFNIKIVKKDYTNVKTVRIFATNDIHGQIEEQGKRASAGETMSYIKKQRNSNNNIVVIDQGDTWQGSIYSNYNHGALLTDMMNYVRYDARTIGNHDFDWGSSYIVTNGLREYNGYTTPTLAANVYDFDFETKTVGDTQRSDIGVPTTSFTLDNGLKVGIVGIIGMNQITSISTLYAQDVAFINHIDVIKKEARVLKQNKGCDIVIASCHTGQEDLLGNGLEECVDLVLCGHTHKRENETENGLYYAQFGSYNQYLGDIEIEYNPTTKGIKYLKKSYISGYDIASTSLDSTVSSLLDKYNSECNDAAKEVVANNVNGSFYSSDNLPNVMCNAIYDQAVKEGYDVDLAYCNQARASLYNEVWDYADLYQAFPFDNVIYIIEVSYNEMVYEIGNYNFVCRSPSFDGKLQKNKKYKVACLDYLAFHTNSQRVYDYFSDNNGNYIGTLEDNYRVILKNWLIESGYSRGKQLNAQDFSADLIKFSRSFTY